MAIADVKEFAHLSDEQIKQLGEEFDAIRKEIEESRGASDAAYIRRLIMIHRAMLITGRVTLFASGVRIKGWRPAWITGAALLGVAKILENMEIGHNTMHGQWDWMNDPEIHSSNWEWDTLQPAEQWKHSHNFIHHQYTNVLGMDNDIGYGILRVTREQKWHPVNLGNPIFNILLGLFFQWGVSLHDLDIESIRKGTKDKKEMKRQLKAINKKWKTQLGKDYLLFPALTGPFFLHTATANATANLMRNVWAYMIIFCGHFPDGAEHFTKEELDNETQPEWYLRQLLGAANFTGGRMLHILSGNLGYQIEHHLFPDLPSNRYAEISIKVREIADRYDIPYTTGPLYKQYGQVFRTIAKMALPNSVWGDEPEPDCREKADQAGDGHPLLATKEGLSENPDGRLNAQPARPSKSTEEGGAAASVA